MQREKIMKVLRITGKVLAGLAVLGVLAAVVFVLVVLPRLPSVGHGVLPFDFDRKMEIQKKAANGTPYTVNNSTATFRLDVAKPDMHSEVVFTNYATALMYCREHGLSVMPSVQLIQGRLKQFDDTLCATLELGMVDSQVQALERLLAVLVRESDAKATEHVATALLLAGVEPSVDQNMRRRAEASRDAFLATPEARPIGFWDGDARLRRSFQSDRYLMQGFSLHQSSDTCIALSRAIAGDAALKESFLRSREFGAKLTNPPQTVPFETLAALTPEDVVKRFPSDAKFALVAYSTSKEQTLIERLNREGKLRGDECLMAVIIEAVRSGWLSLEPKPEAGWYDYQWYALETLLSPERGRESAKLRLSDAYKKRLETAFSAVLVKERETHVKRLPIMTLGSMDGEPDEPPPKVMVTPEFSAEPTATVYLRFGRGYRFLRQALRATLGDEAWSRMRRPSSDRSVDAELQEMAWFCYGLYEKLCLEIGQHPAYLPGEMSAEERAQAVVVFDRWRGAWQDDPALAADTRVAAPVVRWPGGRVRYWSTAGVRLEPVVYEYLDKPTVSGEVEAVFATSTVYLPTDLFLEFKRHTPEPLTRSEFRALCDPCRNAKALRQALGVVATDSTSAYGAILAQRIKSNWGWAVVAAVGLVFWKVRRARLWLALGTVALALGWGCLLAFSPEYRTTFIVRRVAPINEPLGMLSEMRLIPDIPSAPRMRALSRALADSDPQVRYLSARFMLSGRGWHESEAESNTWFQVGVRESLLRATSDPDPEIAALAILGLGNYRDRAIVDYLLAKLPAARSHDGLCQSILQTLKKIRDPSAIEAILPLCEDSRATVSLTAILTLGEFAQPEAQAHLWRLAESPEPPVRCMALSCVSRNCAKQWGPELNEEECKKKFDGMLSERMATPSLPFDVRVGLAWGIKLEPAALEAGATLLEAAASLTQTNQALTWLAGNCLARYGLRRKIGPLPGIISNSTARIEFVQAANRKDPVAAKKALVTIMTAVKDNADSEVSAFAEDGLYYLEKEPENTEDNALEHSRRRRLIRDSDL